MLSVEALRALLGLVPHPIEGGYFVETYRSAGASDHSGSAPPRPPDRATTSARR